MTQMLATPLVERPGRPDAPPPPTAEVVLLPPARPFDFMTCSLAGAAYARPGTAWRWSEAGRLEALPADTPRFDFDPRVTARGQLLGLLHEAAATNHLAWGRRLALGAAKGFWVADGVVLADDTIGLDGEANRASSLAARKDGATLLARVPLPRAEYTFSAWVRRRTGYGRVDITLDGGTTWQEITAYLLGGQWDRVGTDKLGPGHPPLADPEIGFRFTEAGDAIEVDLCQLEAGWFATSEIPTEGATVTRAADALTVDGWTFRWPVDAELSEARHVRSVRLDGSTVEAQWTDTPWRRPRLSKLFDEVV